MSESHIFERTSLDENVAKSPLLMPTKPVVLLLMSLVSPVLYPTGMYCSAIGSRGVVQLCVILPHATEPLVCENKSIVELPKCLVSLGFSHPNPPSSEQKQLQLFQLFI